MTKATGQRAKCVSRMIILLEDLHNEEMYKEIFSPLINILVKHEAILDLSRGEVGVFVYNAGAACRRDIRRAYGKQLIVARENRTIKLGGL